MALYMTVLIAASRIQNFILTTRDYKSWSESYRAYFPNINNPLRQWMYGVPCLTGHEDTYQAVFERQNREICDYFSNRPNDLLQMDVGAGDGWEKLVTFLSPTHLQFPHVNRRTAT